MTSNPVQPHPAQISASASPISAASQSASKPSRRSSRVPKIVLPSRAGVARDSSNGSQNPGDSETSTPPANDSMTPSKPNSHLAGNSDLPSNATAVTPITSSSPANATTLPAGVDPQKPWKHPAELEYICRQDWPQDMIITYLCQNAFTIAPRDHHKQRHFTLVTSIDNSVTVLPRGYRLPLMFVAKFQWESLRLVLTSANPDSEWKEFKFDIVHVSRLCSHLLKNARQATGSISPDTLAELYANGRGDKGVIGGMERSWRCPMFDRALIRFYRRWMVCREWSVKLFWEEFKEEEYENDVLKYDWARWVLKGYKGFLLKKEEVENGITAARYVAGLDNVDGKWIWDTERYVNAHSLAIVPNGDSSKNQNPITNSSDLSKDANQSQTPPLSPISAALLLEITSHTPIAVKRELLDRAVPKPAVEKGNPAIAPAPVAATTSFIQPHPLTTDFVSPNSNARPSIHSANNLNTPPNTNASTATTNPSIKSSILATTPSNAICPAAIPPKVPQTTVNGKSPTSAPHMSNSPVPTQQIAGVKRSRQDSTAEGGPGGKEVGAEKEREAKKAKSSSDGLPTSTTMLSLMIVEPTAPKNTGVSSVAAQVIAATPSSTPIVRNPVPMHPRPNPITTSINPPATQSSASPRPLIGLPPKPHVLLSAVPKPVPRTATSTVPAAKASSNQLASTPTGASEDTRIVTTLGAAGRQDAGGKPPSSTSILSTPQQYTPAKTNSSVPTAPALADASPTPTHPTSDSPAVNSSDATVAGKRPLVGSGSVARKATGLTASAMPKEVTASNELVTALTASFTDQLTTAVKTMLASVATAIKAHQRVILDQLPAPAPQSKTLPPSLALETTEVLEALLGLLEGNQRLNHLVENSRDAVGKQVNDLKDFLEQVKKHVEELEKSQGKVYGGFADRFGGVEGRLGRVDTQLVALKQVVDGIAEKVDTLQNSVDGGVKVLQGDMKGVEGRVQAMELKHEMLVPVKTVVTNVEVQTDAAQPIPLAPPIVMSKRETVGVQTEVDFLTAQPGEAPPLDNALSITRRTIDPDATMVDLSSKEPFPSPTSPPKAPNPSLTRKVLDVMRNMADILELSAYDDNPTRHGKGKERERGEGDFSQEPDVESPLISTLLGEFRLIKEDLKANERRSREEIATLRLLHETELELLRKQLKETEERRSAETEGLVDRMLQEDRLAKEAEGRNHSGERTADGANAELLDLRRRVLYLESRQRLDRVATPPTHERSSSIASSLNFDQKVPHGNGFDATHDRENGSHPLSHLLDWDQEHSARYNTFNSTAASVSSSSPYHDLSTRARDEVIRSSNGTAESIKHGQTQTPFASTNLSRRPSMNSIGLGMDIEGTPLPIKSQRKQLMMSFSKQHADG